MLADILNEFVRHQDQYPEFSPETMVVQNYRLKPGFYFRLREDGKIEELCITKKTELPDNDLMEWFKQADLASDLIEMNKPVDPKKQIHSNNRLTLFCKLNVFLQGEAIHPQLKGHIDRYFDALIQVRDRQNLDILRAAGYKALSKEEADSSKERFLAALPRIRERIVEKRLNEKDNPYIKLFLEAPPDVYTWESGRYLLTKIFNCNDYNLNAEGLIMGLSNANMGMNSKKTFLEHKTTAFKVPYRITAEEGLLLRQLFLWLEGQQTGGKAINSGYIPVGIHEPGLFAAAGEIQRRKPAAYVRFSRGKTGIMIEDYDFLPDANDRLDEPVKFDNYTEAKDYAGGPRNQRSLVEDHIDKFLYGGQLVRNYDVDKVQASKYLPKALAVQVQLSRGAMEAWLRKENDLPLKSAVNKITMDIILARLETLTYVPVLAWALNVRWALMEYFGKENEIMGKTIVNAYEELKERVINAKKQEDPVTCKEPVEFYLAAGQLLYYYFSKSQAQQVNYDMLWRIAGTEKTAAGIKKEHYKYFQRYAHAINLNDPRFNYLLKLIASYEPDKEEPVNLDALFYGFAASNLIFFKEEK